MNAPSAPLLNTSSPNAPPPSYEEATGIVDHEHITLDAQTPPQNVQEDESRKRTAPPVTTQPQPTQPPMYTNIPLPLPTPQPPLPQPPPPPPQPSSDCCLFCYWCHSDDIAECLYCLCCCPRHAVHQGHDSDCCHCDCDNCCGLCSCNCDGCDCGGGSGGVDDSGCDCGDCDCDCSGCDCGDCDCDCGDCTIL